MSTRHNIHKSHEHHVIEIARNVVSKEIAGLTALRDSFGVDFECLTEILACNHGKIIVSGMGKSGHVARKIASTLSSIGFAAIFLHPAEAGHGDLGLISENDIVILLSNSGETKELYSIIDYCKKFENKIVGVTRKLDSTLYKCSDITILLPDVNEASDIDIPTTSATMMMVFGDALAIAMKEIINFTRVDYKKYHPHGNIGAKLTYISEIMHSKEALPVVFVEAKILDAAIEMTSKRLGCVIVVCANGTVVGIVTDGDLRRNINANLSSCCVSDVMNDTPTVVSAGILASEAMALMRSKQITQLIVIDGEKKPIGVVHIHDLVNAGL